MMLLCGGINCDKVQTMRQMYLKGGMAHRGRKGMKK